MLEIGLPADLVERTLAALPAGCLGADQTAEGAGPARIRAYWPSLDAARAAGRDLRERLAGAAGALTIDARALDDGRWAERYQQGLRPFPLGRSFVVHPGGPAPEPAGEPGRFVLRLVPGRAFGTGEHPTTGLCVELLEGAVRAGERWLDVGTGSGILAVAAAVCGASRVLALDTDADALEVAREVVRQNGVAKRVELRHGSVAAAGAESWDGIVANVETPFFLAAAPALAGCLAARGRLIASGIPEPEADAVSRAFAAAGLHPLERRARDGWAALLARGG